MCMAVRWIRPTSGSGWIILLSALLFDWIQCPMLMNFTSLETCRTERTEKSGQREGLLTVNTAVNKNLHYTIANIALALASWAMTAGITSWDEYSEYDLSKWIWNKIPQALLTICISRVSILCLSNTLEICNKRVRCRPCRGILKPLPQEWFLTQKYAFPQCPCYSWTSWVSLQSLLFSQNLLWMLVYTGNQWKVLSGKMLFHYTMKVSILLFTSLFSFL